MVVEIDVQIISRQRTADSARRRRAEKGAIPRKQSRYEKIGGITHRLCTCCDKMLTLNLFSIHGKIHRSQCKSCRSPKDKRWRTINADTIRPKKRAYYQANAETSRERSRQYRLANKEKQAEYMKAYAEDNKEHLREYRQRYYVENKERIRQYVQDNRDSIRERNRVWNNERRHNDREYGLKCSLRKRVSAYIKYYGADKSDKSFSLIGCSMKHLMRHLESQFAQDMSWDNYGRYRLGGPLTWHVDHRIPCDSFDLTDPEQQKICFNWTNLQPLWAPDNMSKNNRLDWIPTK